MFVGMALGFTTMSDGFGLHTSQAFPAKQKRKFKVLEHDGQEPAAYVSF